MKISISKIDSILPQTQCTKCGYKDCYEYAKAVYYGEEYTKCVPGGKQVIIKLSRLLNKSNININSILTNNIDSVEKKAVINDHMCIGCMKCINVCPVGAIIGAKKQMHTIIQSKCTGCDLCIDQCPTKCIKMYNISNKKNNIFTEIQKNSNKISYVQRQLRLKYKNKINKEYINITNKKYYISEALEKFKNKKRKLIHEQKKCSVNI